MDSNKPQNIKKIKFAFLIASIVPILIWFISGLIATFLQSNMQGSLYAFPVPFFPRWIELISYSLFLPLFVLLTVYIAREKKSRRIFIAVVSISIYLALFWLIYWTSFGYVEETGIGYQSLSTNYLDQNYSWSQMEKTAYLDIFYSWDRGARAFRCILRLNASDNAKPMRFNISFKGAEEIRSLVKIIYLLRQNQILVISHFHDGALMKISDDKNMVEFLSLIKTLTVVN